MSWFELSFCCIWYNIYGAAYRRIFSCINVAAQTMVWQHREMQPRVRCNSRAGQGRDAQKCLEKRADEGGRQGGESTDRDST
jgi:hypothetical protein